MAISKKIIDKFTIEAELYIPKVDKNGFVFGYDQEANTYYEFVVNANLYVAINIVSEGDIIPLKKTSLVNNHSRNELVNLRLVTDDSGIYGYINDVCLVYVEDYVEGQVGLFIKEKGAFIKKLTLNNDTHLKADAVLWGHSHMQLWDYYQEDLKSLGKVINMGVGGSNTPYWKELITEVSSYEADTMIVMTGSNDFDNLSPENILAIVQEIFEELRENNPSLKIYLITEFLEPCRLHLEKRYIELNSLYLEYAKENSEWLNIVDSYDIVLNEDGSLNESMFRDEYHMNKKGYDILKERVLEAINK